MPLEDGQLPLLPDGAVFSTTWLGPAAPAWPQSPAHHKHATTVCDVLLCALHDGILPYGCLAFESGLQQGPHVAIERSHRAGGALLRRAA